MEDKEPVLPRAVVVTMPKYAAPPKAPKAPQAPGSTVGLIAIGTFILTFVAFALATL